MEDWEIVEGARVFLQGMKEEGRTYTDPTRRLFAIRWARLACDWLMVVVLGVHGGMKGFLCILDSRQRDLAGQFVGVLQFNPKSSPPFELLWFKVHVEGEKTFDSWVREHLNKKGKALERAREFTDAYLQYANEVISRATEEDLCAEVELRRRPCGIPGKLPWEVSGGAPGLGKR